MSALDRLRSVFSRFKGKPKDTKSNNTKPNSTASTFGRGSSSYPDIREIEAVPDMGGTRISMPSTLIGGGGAFGALPRKAQRDLNLDDRRLARMPIEDLIDTLIDAHPDVSYAVWNYLRLGNTDFDITVESIGTGGERDANAEEELKHMLEQLELPSNETFEVSRSLKKTVNQLLLSAITRGAVACELVLTSDMNDVGFIAPVDPITVDFEFVQDRLIPSQDDGDIDLDIPTFFYEGLDERIDDPYGRSPIIGALNVVVFQLQVLNDIKAVVHNHGYPKIDIKIVEEVLLQRMPIRIRNNEQAKQDWLRDRMSEIISMYSDLEPDDAFVHFDSVEIDTAGGSKGGGGAMIDPEKLMTAIDNLIMTGLKTLSTVLGRRSTGNTESFAKLEIKLYLQGVKAIQEVVERVLGKALTLALNIRGQQGIVKFKFKPIEIRTSLEKEQFEMIKYQNLAFKRNQGWISQEEAAYEAVGHEPVSEPLYDILGQGGMENKDGEPVQPTTDENPSAGGGGDDSSPN